jgi:hypothetical protein
MAVYLRMREEEAWIIGGRCVITCGDGRYGFTVSVCSICWRHRRVSAVSGHRNGKGAQGDRYVTLTAEYHLTCTSTTGLQASRITRAARFMFPTTLLFRWIARFMFLTTLLVSRWIARFMFLTVTTLLFRWLSLDTSDIPLLNLNCVSSCEKRTSYMPCCN